MTKILYIPTGEYLYFNEQSGGDCDSKIGRTVIYEKSKWHFNREKGPECVIETLCSKDEIDNNITFKRVNDLPPICVKNEFEIVYD
jgi:hypothetical protein